MPVELGTMADVESVAVSGAPPAKVAMKAGPSTGEVGLGEGVALAVMLGVPELLGLALGEAEGCAQAPRGALDTARMRELPVSAMSRRPEASTARPAGLLSRAEEAGRPSPEKPAVWLVPAATNMVPLGKMMRTR